MKSNNNIVCIVEIICICNTHYNLCLFYKRAFFACSLNFLMMMIKFFSCCSSSYRSAELYIYIYSLIININIYYNFNIIYTCISKLERRILVHYVLIQCIYLKIYIIARRKILEIENLLLDYENLLLLLLLKIIINLFFFSSSLFLLLVIYKRNILFFFSLSLSIRLQLFSGTTITKAKKNNINN